MRPKIEASPAAGPTEIRDVLAFNIRRLRKERGLTQFELGDKAGTTGTHIGFIETKRSWVTPEMLTAIAKELKVEPCVLFENPRAETEAQIQGKVASLFKDLANLVRPGQDIGQLAEFVELLGQANDVTRINALEALRAGIEAARIIGEVKRSSRQPSNLVSHGNQVKSKTRKNGG